MYGYIYKTTDLTNGKIYIGQHKHSSFDKNYYGSGILFNEVLKQKTKSNFQCILIEECDSLQSMNERETYWIAYYNSTDPKIGYNLAHKGTGCSEYQRSIASEYMKNRVVSDATRARMSRSASDRTANRVTNNGKIWLNNGVEEFLISKDLLDTYDYSFYSLGRIPNNYTSYEAKIKYANGVYMNKNGVTKFVDKDDVDKYIQEGFVCGKSSNNYSLERNVNLSRSKRNTICITDGERNFYIKQDLLDDYLNKGFHKGSYQAYKRKNK